MIAYARGEKNVNVLTTCGRHSGSGQWHAVWVGRILLLARQCARIFVHGRADGL